LEGKSGGPSAPILLTPEIVGHRKDVMPASRCTYYTDGEVPARQPGSGKAKASTDAMLIPSRAATERSVNSLCRAR
jgi:hypothetical protein